MELVKRILLLLAKYWLPCLVWALVIFLFSSRPTGVVSTFDWQDFIIKKMAHVVEYGLFVLLLYRALRSAGVKRRNAGLYSIFLAVLYGISDEFHQSFVPGRIPSVWDVLIFDHVGVLLGLWLANRLVKQ